jgi:hypothetical protein
MASRADLSRRALQHLYRNESLFFEWRGIYQPNAVEPAAISRLNAAVVAWLLGNVVNTRT